jgi:hypothetical protein
LFSTTFLLSKYSIQQNDDFLNIFVISRNDSLPDQFQKFPLKDYFYLLTGHFSADYSGIVHFATHEAIVYYWELHFTQVPDSLVVKCRVAAY